MDVVIAGGGVAAIETALALRDHAGNHVDITLVAPDEHYVYSAQSVGTAFGRGEPARVALAELADEFAIALVRDTVVAVDAPEHVALLGSERELRYDKAVIAAGARCTPAFEHALTFGGPADVDALRDVMEEVDGGRVLSLAFVVPPGVAWSLPAYELALLAKRRAPTLAVTVVTPEDRPLGVFGRAASDDVAALLEQADIELVLGASADVPDPWTVVCHPGDRRVQCGHVVALPNWRGRHLRGLPSDAEGFLPVDSFARVAGVDDVYAAGDGTNFPLKQGGIACQQADVAAMHIAAAAGALVEPTPFRPVLRGRLMTGGRSRYMRRDLSGRLGDREESSDRVLWWPGTKVAGRYLAAFLARDGRDGGGSLVAPGMRRRAFLLPEAEQELRLYGYEFNARWPRTA